MFIQTSSYLYLSEFNICVVVTLPSKFNPLTPNKVKSTDTYIHIHNVLNRESIYTQQKQETPFKYKLPQGDRKKKEEGQGIGRSERS